MLDEDYSTGAKSTTLTILLFNQSDASEDPIKSCVLNLHDKSGFLSLESSILDAVDGVLHFYTTPFIASFDRYTDTAKDLFFLVTKLQMMKNLALETNSDLSKYFALGLSLSLVSSPSSSESFDPMAVRFTP